MVRSECTLQGSEGNIITSQQTQIFAANEVASEGAPGISRGWEQIASHADLSVSSARERTQAAATLVATLTEIARKKQNVDDTMALLLRETRGVRSRRRRKNMLRGLAFGVLLLMFVLFRQHVWGWYWIFQLSGGAWMVESAATAKARKDAARTLNQAEDPRAVGVLAVALRDGDSPLQRLAESALLKLLPRVRPSHAAYVDEDQMAALLSIAQHDDPALRVALLRALEQIGDGRALPVVEHLRKDAWKIVSEQAEQCLPYVQERIRKARESATLLRASHAVPSSAHLLRPAHALAPTDPSEELLRPS